MKKWGFASACAVCVLAMQGMASSNCYGQGLSQVGDTGTSTASKKQDGSPPAAPGEATEKKQQDRERFGSDYNNSLGPHLFKSLAEDQKTIWTSPAHLRMADADWLLPLGAVLGGTLATDTEVSKHLSNSPSRLSHSKSLSDYGLAAMVGAGGAMYVWGRITHNEHRRETGFLAGEAALNSLAVTYATKYAFGRERPLTDNYRGRFLQGGDSFPSLHSSVSWSIAGVFSHEYPGPLASLLSYGMASAISASRVDAKQHFPSDVLVGAAVGWFIGQEVYRHHHNPEAGGRDWQTYVESREDEAGRVLGTRGSPYVELDSWVYPAIERLAALGYIHSEFLGMRPWTRIECAQLVDEAGDRLRADVPARGDAERLYSELVEEFRGDLNRLGSGEKFAQVESVYSRVMGINGPPLNDSRHFGQTVYNDYGRPYQEGLNTYDGFSAYGSAGRFTVYFRGEYQHSPFAPAYSAAIRQAISTMDTNPIQPAVAFAEMNQFRMLDTYVAATAANWNFSFGKQSLWWGPGDQGSLIFSDNAEPIYMFRVSRTAPFRLPWVLSYLGPMKIDAFVGKLSGNQFPPRPAIHGEKISFKPTKNVEFGFTRMAEFGGVGRPLTLGAIWHSYTSVKESDLYAANDNPGKRTAGLDFSYRLPFVRDWATLYFEALSSDDPSPLANPPRAGYSPGIYITHLPGVRRLDLRVEGVNTRPNYLGPGTQAKTFIYSDFFYHDLSTNKGNLIGSWMGREGQGYQASSTYWVSSRNSFQVGYRHAKVATDLVPGGETVNDGSLNVNWALGSHVSISSAVQYEKWLAPLLAPGPQSNWTSTVQVTYQPHGWTW